MALINLEDAVLSLLGEANQNEPEVTQTGIESPLLRRSARRNDETRVRTRKGVAPINFGLRRSDNELPWSTLPANPSEESIRLA